MKFGKHKAKGFEGEIKDETGKVFWGHIWSRAGILKRLKMFGKTAVWDKK